MPLCCDGAAAAEFHDRTCRRHALMVAATLAPLVRRREVFRRASIRPVELDFGAAHLDVATRGFPCITRIVAALTMIAYMG